MKKLYYFLLLGILGWCLLILIPNPLIHYMFRFVCHQLPERTLWNLPVCARCLGVYFGALLGMLLVLIKQKYVSKRMFLLLLIPAMLDVGLQLTGLWSSTNLLRLLTGGLAGIITAIFLADRIL